MHLSTWLTLFIWLYTVIVVALPSKQSGTVTGGVDHNPVPSASAHPPLPIDCNSTGQNLVDQECATFVVNYLQTYTGAGNFLDPPAPYNSNIIPIFLRKLLQRT